MARPNPRFGRVKQKTYGGSMDLDRGEIYFIREQVGAGYSEFTKIGLVGEREGRSSADRAKEHQTGNPRLLHPETIIATPFVHAVENRLHREFAAHRLLPGEWFRFDDALRARAVARGRELARDYEEQVPTLERADSYEGSESLATTAEATGEARDWQRQYRLAHAAISRIEASEERLRAYLRAQAEAGRDISKVAKIQARAGSTTFDRVRFAQDHPHLVAAYTETSFAVVGQLRVRALPDEDFSGVDELAEIVRLTGALDPLIARGADADTLFDIHQIVLELVGQSRLAQSQKDLAGAHLKVACGLHAGIDGVCTWKRANAPKERFLREQLQRDNPDLYGQYLSVGPATSSVQLNYGRSAGD